MKQTFKKYSTFNLTITIGMSEPRGVFDQRWFLIFDPEIQVKLDCLFKFLPFTAIMLG